MRVSNFVVYFFFLFATKAVYALDQCGCSAALNANIMDSISLKTGSSSEYSSLDDFCSSNSDTTTTMRELGGDFSSLDIDVGITSKKTKSTSSIRKLCDKKFKDGSSDVKFKMTQNSVNPILANAYSQCILSCNNKSFGFTTTRNDEELTINVVNKQGSPEIQDFTLSVFDIDKNSEDESNFVECSIRVESDVIAPRSLMEPIPQKLVDRKIPINKSATIQCKRKKTEVVLKSSIVEGLTKTVNYFPGFSVNLVIGDGVISETMLTKPDTPITSMEHDSLVNQITEYKAAVKSEFIKMNENHKLTKTHLSRLINRKAHRRTGSNGVLGKKYTNDLDIPKLIVLTAYSPNNSCDVVIFINGKQVIRNTDNTRSFARICSATAIIPPKAEYIVKSAPYRSSPKYIWYEYF